MTRLAQKERERLYLDRMRGLLGDFPIGMVQDHEKPDFLVHDPRGVVGIEITELHHEPDGQPIPQQGREAVREQLAQRAKAIYDAAGHPAVDCSVHLKDISLRGSEIGPLAAAIAELAKRNMPSASEFFRWEENDGMHRAHFPDEIDYIRVARYPGLTESFFSAPGSTWVEQLGLSHIGSVLGAKEPSYAVYRKHCTAAWLVILVDGHRMSTWFDDAEQVRAATFRTRFERVFVLRNFNSELIELNTTWP